MIFEINLDEYLSSERIKEIIEEETRERVREMLRTSGMVENFLANSSYKIVWNILEEWFRDHNIDFERLISDKVKTIINGLTSYSVFYKRDNFHMSDSPAQKILDNAVYDSRDLIEEKVWEILNGYPYDELAGDAVMDTVTNVIADILYTGAKHLRGED